MWRAYVESVCGERMLRTCVGNVRLIVCCVGRSVLLFERDGDKGSWRQRAARPLLASAM